MTNRRINDGDTAWINPDQKPRIGRVVAALAWNLDGDECGNVIKIWRDSQPEGALWSDGEEGRIPLPCSRYELLGPVVWISPRGYPPD